MSEKNLTLEYPNIISYRDGETYRVIHTVEVELHGRKHTVCVLREEEAKARISEEYGFEYNSIKIEGTCWYEATDMNYFRFSVRGWQYEVRDYGFPEWIDDVSRNQRFTVSLTEKPKYFKNGLPEEYQAKKIGVITDFPYSEKYPVEIWETKDGGKAVVFADGIAVLISREDYVGLAFQTKIHR